MLKFSCLRKLQIIFLKAESLCEKLPYVKNMPFLFYLTFVYWRILDIAKDYFSLKDLVGSQSVLILAMSFQGATQSVLK